MKSKEALVFSMLLVSASPAAVFAGEQDFRAPDIRPALEAQIDAQMGARLACELAARDRAPAPPAVAADSSRGGDGRDS
jgi:hypothetical protein